MPDYDSEAKRVSPLAMDSQHFREAGHALIDQIATFLDTLPQQRVTPAESPTVVRQALQADRPLNDHGEDPAPLLNRAASLLFEHSLFNSHPRFWGYITSSAAPIGALGDLLAAAVNPNVGAWLLSPIASEIEAQTIRWIADLLHYPTDCGASSSAVATWPITSASSPHVRPRQIGTFAPPD